MKTETARNTGLALVGLLALTVYILACASFSPDDKKILYPSFDPHSGAVGVALYDRETSRSRMLFVPVAYADTNSPDPALLRPQWLTDGRRILVAWGADGQHDEGLNLAVLTISGEGPVKLFRFPELKEAAQHLMMPLPLAGENVLLPDSKGLVRLNLANGRIIRHEFSEDISDLWLYAGRGDQTVFYVEEKGEEGHVFGRLNAETFARAPLMTFTNKPVEGSFFTYNDGGKRLAFVDEVGDVQRLVVLESGRPAMTRPLATKGEKLRFGNAVFLERKELVLASFMRSVDQTASFGLLEIPLKNQAIRETVLIPKAEITDDLAAFYFQAGVSHDGKTAALSSMYLACAGKSFRPEDCALFLVDLTDPRRKVTKVPIKMPAELPGLPGK